ncbi:hypothetical protein JCM11641_002428 [Rhodosporidiobolus odoratus]
MLSSYIVPHITGRYDFTLASIALPEVVVRALLPQEWASQPDLFLTSEDLRFPLPDIEDGMSWVCVEAGKQIETGMAGVPGGKRTFFEAKLEIPFLRHPNRAAAPFTFKHTMLFSSRMMAFSSANITGLRSHRVAITQSTSEYEATGFLGLVEEAAAAVSDNVKWAEELARKVLEGWWVGENTGDVATRFHMTSLSPAQPRHNLLVRLNLPALLRQPHESVFALVGPTALKMDAAGWVELPAAGFAFNEETRMEAGRVDSL